MMLCRMTHGDMVVDSSSWYLQSALIVGAVPNGSEVYYGYLLEDVVYPVAGGWDDERLADLWEPFVVEIEQRNALAARIPWTRSKLRQFHPSDFAGVERIDTDCFRFAPLGSRLLVRPLDLYVTEPLF